MDPRIVATVGLGMDIVGIVLLFWYGAIGGGWIDAPKRELVVPKQLSAEEILRRNPMITLLRRLGAQAVERNEHRARVGSRWGLGLAATGFALQAWAQWM